MHASAAQSSDIAAGREHAATRVAPTTPARAPADDPIAELLAHLAQRSTTKACTDGRARAPSCIV